MSKKLVIVDGDTGEVVDKRALVDKFARLGADIIESDLIPRRDLAYGVKRLEPYEQRELATRRLIADELSMPYARRFLILPEDRPAKSKEQPIDWLPHVVTTWASFERAVHTFSRVRL